jgi:hypothetical protein
MKEVMNRRLIIAITMIGLRDKYRVDAGRNTRRVLGLGREVRCCRL